MQYLECTPPADAIDRELGCICLRWVNADGGEEIDGSCHYGAEWFGLEPVEAIRGSIHIVRGNMAIHPHTQELPWTEHQLYVNRFYREIEARKCFEGAKGGGNAKETSSTM